MNFWIRTTMDWMFCSITWWLPLKWCGKRSRTRWLSLISSSINTNGFHVFFSSEIDGSNDLNASLNTSHNRSSPLNLSKNGNHQYSDETSAFKRFTLGRTDNKRLHRKIKKYHLGEATDDVRLCIMCLRAIMNNQVQASETPPTIHITQNELETLPRTWSWRFLWLFQNGFNLVIQHPSALNYITLGLQHKNYR